MSDEVWKRDEVESPCVKICTIHPDTRLCIGCLRSIDEISVWGKLSYADRQAIKEQLPQRQALLQKRRGGRRRRQLN